jgi:alpha-L-fucosidase
MLTDIVSKNGNLMLNIPLRGDGSPDEHELEFLAGLTAWMDVNSEGIFATRPWKIYGEGPSTTAPPVRGYGRTPPPYVAEDIRFTTKGDTLYAFVGAWPESRSATIKSLAENSPQVAGRKIADVSLLGYDGKLDWTQTADGLTVKLPEKAPSEHAVTLRIKGLTA